MSTLALSLVVIGVTFCAAVLYDTARHRRQLKRRRIQTRLDALKRGR